MRAAVVTLFESSLTKLRSNEDLICHPHKLINNIFIYL